MLLRVFLKTPFVVSKSLPKSFRLFSKGLGATYISRMAAFHTFSLCPLQERYGKTGLSGNGTMTTDVRFRKIMQGSTLRSLVTLKDTYLDEVLKRKRVRIGRFDYHMPRYYQDKIYKYEVSLSSLTGSKKKTLVASALSVALADRTFRLRCENFDSALEVSKSSFSSPFEVSRFSESFSFLSRNYKAQQSLQSFYQRSRF